VRRSFTTPKLGIDFRLDGLGERGPGRVTYNEFQPVTGDASGTAITPEHLSRFVFAKTEAADLGAGDGYLLYAGNAASPEPVASFVPTS
jgi:hypothetical protein